MNTRTLSELAALCGARLEGDGARPVDGPASLAEAGPREISFYANAKYKDELLSTRAAAVLVARDLERPREDLALLRCDDPSAAFSLVVGAFVEPAPRPAPGVHRAAVVDPSAAVDPSASVGPLCAIGARARVEAGAVLHGSVVLGTDVRVGPETVLHPGVVCYPGVSIGARCVVHAGTVLGSDGFGFAPVREGGREPGLAWKKVPQCGTVVVEDDVEIGANVAIDRGRFGATRIGRGAKIDNLVHVAHNVVVGEGALLIAQVGIAGSARIGPRAIVAGQAGINGHVDIGAGAKIGGGSGIVDDVPAGAEYFGYPGRPRAEAMRQMALVERLPEIRERLKALEKKLSEIERSRA